MEYKRKIKIRHPLKWPHHRHGWDYVVSQIHKNLHSENGVDFFVNGVVPLMVENYETINKNPWSGVMHTTPSDKNLSENLAKNTKWHESLKSCLGVFTFSEYSKNHLENFIKEAPVVKIFHPLVPGIQFNWEEFILNKCKKIYLLGHWRRNFEDFYKLECPYEKIIVSCNNSNHKTKGKVSVKNYMPAREYDRLFRDNIVFLALEDASANNTVLECIGSNTPVLVNRHPAVAEYLGENYPLFYDSLNHARELLENFDNIEKTHKYLISLDKSVFTMENFIGSIANSQIYKNLPSVGKIFL